MKNVVVMALAATLLCGTASMAQPGGGDRDHGKSSEQDGKKDEKGKEASGNAGRALGRASGGPVKPTTPIQAGPIASRDQAARNPIIVHQTRTAAPVPPSNGSDGRNRAEKSRPSPVEASQPVRAAPPASNLAATPRDRVPGQPQPMQPQSTRAENGRQGVLGGRSSSGSPQGARWSRGDRVPQQYQQSQYYVNDWQLRGLRQPPGGYRWVRDDNNDFYLALIATGVISDVLYRSDMDANWQRSYSRTYSYNDDVYYQQCRRSPDPAGVLIGGLIGGLLGNAAGGNRGGATLAGVILGGAVGAALTSKMDCVDRSYAYKSYYDGFNSGRPGSNFTWRNPQNSHRGEIQIKSYYNDPYGFRCARFNQVTYIQGQSYNASGVACRQPDGSWAAVR